MKHKIHTVYIYNIFKFLLLLVLFVNFSRFIYYLLKFEFASIFPFFVVTLFLLIPIYIFQRYFSEVMILNDKIYVKGFFWGKYKEVSFIDLKINDLLLSSFPLNLFPQYKLVEKLPSGKKRVLRFLGSTFKHSHQEINTFVQKHNKVLS